MPDNPNTEFSITTGPLPGSKKIYVRSEDMPDVRVPHCKRSACAGL